MKRDIESKKGSMPQVQRNTSGEGFTKYRWRTRTNILKNRMYIKGKKRNGNSRFVDQRGSLSMEPVNVSELLN